MTDYKAKDPLDFIAQAYSKILEQSMDEWHQLQEKTPEALHNLIDEISEKSVKLKELSQEEAPKIAHALKRDFAEAGEHLGHFSDDLKTWIGFETKWIESDLFRRFLSAADQTRVSLRDLYEQASMAPYKTGEITGPGALTCDSCGEVIHFENPGRIPPCPKCHHTQYTRVRKNKG